MHHGVEPVRTDAGPVQGVHVRDDQRHDAVAGALEHDGLGHVGQVVQHHLDLLGIDVLAVVGQDHVLAAAQQEDVPFGVHRADVAGAEPAVAEHRGGRFRILVVAPEHDVPLDGEFTGDMLRIRGIHAEFHDFRQVLPAGLGDVLPRPAVGDDGGEFGQPVPRHEGHLQLVNQQVLQFEGDGGSARDEGLDPAAHRRHQLVVQHLAILGKVLIMSEFLLPFRAVHLGAEDILGKLDEDQGHAVEDARPHLHQGRVHIGRNRRKAEHRHVHAGDQRDHHVASEAETVGVREQAQVVLAPVEGEARAYALDVRRIVAAGQHHALWVAGGAGGIKDRAHVVEVRMRHAEVRRQHPAGELLLKETRSGGINVARAVAAGQHLPAAAVHRTEQLGHLSEVHRGEEALFGIEEAAVGMVHEPLRIGGGKSVVQLDGHVAFADGRHEDGSAQGAASGVDGSLVARLQAGVFPDEVEGFDPLRQPVVVDGRLAEVAQGRVLPIVAHGGLEKIDEIVDLKHFSFSGSGCEDTSFLSQRGPGNG